jgi:hypothetical protein
VSDRCVSTMFVIVVSAIAINHHTVSCLAKSTHFIWLILNNTWGIREVLHWMPLESISWVLQRGNVSISIKLRITLAWVQVEICRLVSHRSRHLLVWYRSHWFCMKRVWVKV